MRSWRRSTAAVSWPGPTEASRVPSTGGESFQRALWARAATRAQGSRRDLGAQRAVLPAGPGLRGDDAGGAGEGPERLQARQVEVRHGDDAGGVAGASAGSPVRAVGGDPAAADGDRDAGGRDRLGAGVDGAAVAAPGQAVDDAAVATERDLRAGEAGARPDGGGEIDGVAAAAGGAGGDREATVGARRQLDGGVAGRVGADHDAAGDGAALAARLGQQAREGEVDPRVADGDVRGPDVAGGDRALHGEVGLGHQHAGDRELGGGAAADAAGRDGRQVGAARDQPAVLEEDALGPEDHVAADAGVGGARADRGDRAADPAVGEVHGAGGAQRLALGEGAGGDQGGSRLDAADASRGVVDRGLEGEVGVGRHRRGLGADQDPGIDAADHDDTGRPQRLARRERRRGDGAGARDRDPGCDGERLLDVARGRPHLGADPVHEHVGGAAGGDRLAADRDLRVGAGHRGRGQPRIERGTVEARLRADVLVGDAGIRPHRALEQGGDVAGGQGDDRVAHLGVGDVDDPGAEAAAVVLLRSGGGRDAGDHHLVGADRVHDDVLADQRQQIEASGEGSRRHDGPAGGVADGDVAHLEVAEDAAVDRADADLAVDDAVEDRLGLAADHLAAAVGVGKGDHRGQRERDDQHSDQRAARDPPRPAAAALRHRRRLPRGRHQ
jgi:hypothetical protein